MSKQAALFLSGLVIAGLVFAGAGYAQEAGTQHQKPEVASPEEMPGSPGKTPPVSARGPETRSYMVEEGDTLGKIARDLLGDEDQWKVIARANGIEDPKQLEVGMRLKIPAASEAGSTPSVGREAMAPKPRTPEERAPEE